MIKQSNLLFLAIIIFFSLTTLGQNTLTKKERDNALAYLKETKTNLLNNLDGLSDAQVNFKPNAESWSIAECVEHLAISESLIFSFVQGSLKTEADPSIRGEVKMTDEQIIQLITDRSGKVKTKEPFEPKNNFGSYQGSLDEFLNKRKHNLKYVKTTKDDLRNHYFDFPFGKADTYQVILFMAGHSTRHIKQIEEILANPSFPNS